MELGTALLQVGLSAGGGMSVAEMYRQHAADCVRLAQSVSGPEDRTLLMEMAAMWLRLAERTVARGKEPDAEN
jgi:hypothetical protein